MDKDRYVFDSPEDMDEAPDAGDMFEDDETDYADLTDGSRRRGRQKRGMITRGLLCVLWAVWVLLAGAYVYFLFINDSLWTVDVTGRDNTVTIDIPEGANYSLCRVDDINQLIDSYLLARAKVDVDTLRRLVTDPSEFDNTAGIELTAEYITAYTMTTCYMVPGCSDGSYIIYELSNLTIKDVSSTPLDVKSFYVTRQSDGSYKINNSQLSDDEMAYIESMNETSDVQGIYEHAKERNDYLLRTDAEFNAFYTDYMNKLESSTRD